MVILILLIFLFNDIRPMEPHVFKNIISCWKTKVTFSLEISGGKISGLLLNVGFFQR